MTTQPTVNIGFGNIVLTDRIIAVVNPSSAPMKRMVAEAKEKGQLIDATFGRRTRSIVIHDSGQITLSAVSPETIGERIIKQ